MVIAKLKDLYEKTIYVWRVSKRPENKELMEKFKVVMVGVLVMGFIGFFISLIFTLIKKPV